MFKISVSKLQILFVCCGLLLSLGLALHFRLPAALKADVWLDETTVYTMSSGFSFQRLFFINHIDAAHPPLLYFFVRVILYANHFRYIDIHTIRIFFALCSSFAVFPIYFLGQKILKTKIAVFLSLWYAIDPYHVQQGYSMRPYSILQLIFPIACFAIFPEYWNRKWKIIAFNLLFIFLFFWDYASVWLFLSLFSYWLISSILTKKNILFTRIKQLIPFLFLVLLWIPIFLQGFNDALSAEKYVKPNIFKYFLHLSGGLGILDKNYNSIIDSLDAKYLIVFLVIFTANILFLLKKKNISHIFIVFGSLLPMFVAHLFSFTVSPITAHTNHLFTAIIFIFSYGALLQLKRFGILYGLLITFALWSSIQVPFYIYQSKQINTAVSTQEIQNLENFRVFSYGNYFETYYPLKFWMLQKGFQLTKNSQCEFYPSHKLQQVDLSDQKSPFTFSSTNCVFAEDLDSLVQQQPSNENFFIAPASSWYTYEQQLQISSYCPLTAEDFQKLGESLQPTLLKCRKN
jgi:hypothetical protein